MAPMDPSIAIPVDSAFDDAAEARIAACVLRALAVLRRHPSGLVTDIDGTVSEMAPAPDLAVIDRGALKSLELMALQLAIVGVVTGRAAADALRLTGLPDFLHIGNHGYEQVHGVRQSFAPGVEPYLSGISEAAEAVRSAQRVDRDLTGAVIENKRFTASFHYRLCPDPDQAEATIRAIVQPIALAANLKMSGGKMVIELRPPLSVNKGSAISDLIFENGLKGLIFFGDDITDIDGFVAVRSYDRSLDFTGLAVAIVTPDSSPLVAESADLSLHGVRECAEVLRRLAAFLAETAGERGTETPE
jgi:trehalose 6-phosphate phosphatase